MNPLRWNLLALLLALACLALATAAVVELVIAAAHGEGIYDRHFALANYLLVVGTVLRIAFGRVEAKADEGWPA